MSFRDTLLAPLLIDGYKAYHKFATHKDVGYQFNNYTNRSGKLSKSGLGFTVQFGIRVLVREYLMKDWNRFFEMDRDYVEREYIRVISNYKHIPENEVQCEHILALHDLGYLPLQMWALPEGTLVPYQVPSFVVRNTHPDFAWIVGLGETQESCEFWELPTAASIAYAYRKNMEDDPSIPKELIKFLGHDFSYRGDGGFDMMCKAGAGHLASFVGTDSVPAGLYLEYIYGDKIDENLVFASVDATEHSCEMSNILIRIAQMSDEQKAGREFDELMLEAEQEYMKDLLTNVTPKGILSYVSDGNDFWSVVTKILPNLKEEIMNRDGKFVIRPDCYSEDTKILTPEGWKFFKDLTKDDLVAQVYDDGHYDFVKPSKYVDQYYQGVMHHFKDFHGKVDLLVTPNHRMVVQQNGVEKIRFAETFPVKGYCSQKMIRSARAESAPEKMLTLQERLNIAFQADGSYTTTGDNIRFSFAKDRKKERLIKILDAMNTPYKIYDLADGRVEFNIKVNSLDYSKNFEWVDTSNLTYEWCVDFIDELSHWDSSIRNESRIKFDTTNFSVIQVVELVALSAGYGCYIATAEDKRKDIFNDVYTAHIMKNNLCGGQSWSHSTVDYIGKIYCVTVPTGKLLVKRNQCTMVCGNSGVPEDIICGLNSKAINLSGTSFDDTAEMLEYAIAFTRDEHANILADNPSIEVGPIERQFKYGADYYNVKYIPHLAHDDAGYYLIDDDYVVTEVEDTPEQKGLIELLWEMFDGQVDNCGQKVLNDHIGAIYGDSITLERQKIIYERLADKGYSRANITLGIGSYTYQYNTRDSEGSAIKCTNMTLRDGTEVPIFKAPKTDPGKKSAMGYLKVIKDEKDQYILKQNVSWSEFNQKDNCLSLVFKDGLEYNPVTLKEIRTRLWGENF